MIKNDLIFTKYYVFFDKDGDPFIDKGETFIPAGENKPSKKQMEAFRDSFINHINNKISNMEK